MKLHLKLALAAAMFALPLSALTGAATAQGVDPAVMAPINMLNEGFNTNQPAKLAGSQVASPIILDEFAPYQWSGPAALMGWGSDFGKFAVSHGVMSGKVEFADPTVAEVDGDHAYVVSPSIITFKTKDGQIKNAGTFTFALVKQADGWKIASWAYARGAALP